MINVYKLDDPIDATFAQAIRLGTWSPAKSKACPECGRSNQKRISPLVIEWESGANNIGDFTWPSFNEDVVITQPAKDLLEKAFKDIQFKKVVVKKKTQKQMKMGGIESQTQMSSDKELLWEVSISSWCHIDLRLTGLELEKECSICGRSSISSTGPLNDKVIIDRSTWNGTDFFRIHEYPRWVFCTESAKVFLENAKLTNVIFSLFGSI